MNAKPLTKLDEARMRALRNGIYHTMRRTFFERSERVLNFVVIMLGTATATEASQRFLGADAAFYLGGLTAFVGAAQLVWGPGGRARDHAVLQGQFFALVARAEARPVDVDLAASEIEQELAKLYASETTTMHAVNALAYNAAQNANGRDTQLTVRWHERWLANVRAFSADRFRPSRPA